MILGTQGGILIKKLPDQSCIGKFINGLDVGIERNPRISATNFYMISSIEVRDKILHIKLMSEMSLLEYNVYSDAEVDVFDNNPQLNTEEHILNLIDLNYNEWMVKNLANLYTTYFCKRINIRSDYNFGANSKIIFNYNSDNSFKFNNDFNFHVEYLLISNKNINPTRCNIDEDYYHSRSGNAIFDIYCGNSCKDYNSDYYYENINNPRYIHYKLYEEYKAKKIEIENKYKKSIDKLDSLVYNLNTVEDNLEDFEDIKLTMQSKLDWMINKKSTELKSAWFEYEIELESLDNSKLYTKYFLKGEM